VTPDTAVLPAEGLARLRALRPAAIDAVTLRFYEEHAGVYSRFGQAGRDACREDLGFHLEFLQPVLEFGLLKPMVDYLRWLVSVLVARDVPAEHVGQSLDWLAEFFDANLDAAEARVVSGALQAAKQQLLALGPVTGADEAHEPKAWPECDAFEANLLAGNQRGAIGIIDAAMSRGSSLVEAEMHIVQPAMYRIGRQWQANRVSVAQEHLSTVIARMAMARGLLQAEPAPPNGRKVLLACVQGNDHAVGLQMVADAFELAGWEVQFLGADVPTASLVSQVAAFRPNLLGLSVSFVQQLRVVKVVVARLQQSQGAARPRIMVGGLAINRFEGLASMLGADAWSGDAQDAVVTGERLVAGQSAARGAS